MKKYTLLFLLFITISVFGQSENQVGWIAKFGAAGGFSPMILFPNFDDVNLKLEEIGLDKLSGPIYAPGGGGYAYVMIIDNLRLGGLGFGGSQSANKTLNNLENKVIYSLSGGAGSVEYTMPFVKDIALSAGLLIGGGGVEIDIHQNSDTYDWNKIWNDVKNQENVVDKNYNLSNSFFFLSPTLNVDIPITRFIAFRAGLGYQITFGSSWEIGNEKELINVPSGLNGNSFFIQTGLYVGLFAF